MKEYTILALLSILLVVILDNKTRIRILRTRQYYLFFSVIVLFKLLVNGYLTGQSIVLYNPRFFLGLRVGTIPFEDFLFGFSMVTMTIVFWEYFKRKHNDISSQPHSPKR